MADLGSQGGIVVHPDQAPVIGANPGEPKRPDQKATSVVAPPKLPYIGNNDKAKVK